MISRRNIRVKVMQTLYTLATLESGGDDSNKKTGAQLLTEKLNRSLDLFTTSILYTLRVAQYAETDAHLRASKYLPSAADLSVSTKIAGNTFLWQVLENKTFSEKVKEAQLERYIDDEWIKKLYQQLAKSEAYQQYIATQERNPKDEKAIMQYIWENQILGNESLQEYFADEISGWEDDREMTQMLMENFFRNNQKVNFLSLISLEKKEYAQSLLQTVLEKDSYVNELIKPKLINWDAERVALIDLLLLRMGICELLYFPTIPTKVTINEYIEIAKLYSTPQSGQFVNGVLDNILKDLESENLIRKQDRKPKS